MSSAIMPNETAATLDAMFMQRARAHAEKPALYVDGHHVTYAELWSLQLDVQAAIESARCAMARGRIAMLSPKCLDAYAALLAIMASGNVYVPLSPTHPTGQLKAIAHDAGFLAWVVHRSCLPLLAELIDPSDPVVVLVIGDADATPIPMLPKARYIEVVRGNGPLAAQAPRETHNCDLAYLMYTSGSTGVPKGVPVSHANAIALLRALREPLGLTPTDRMTHFPELTFDFSIGEIFPCWDAGACLYVATAGDLRSPAAFVRRHRLTVWSSVPTLAAFVRERAQIRSEPMPMVRLSIFCGEALPHSLAQQWRSLAPATRVLNLYGPTEVTVFATAFEFDGANPPDGDWLPIGWPLDQVKARVVAPDGSPATDGTAGELWLQGPQVFGGYWNTAANQQECLVRDASPDAEPWYRTGDLAAWTAHGLAFHGRIDRQVKVRGYRIELQEIEAVLRRLFPGTELAVVATNGDVQDTARLVAFFARATVNQWDHGDAMRRCAAHLPAYMVPAVVEVLETLPTNHNGKVDLLALTLLAQRRCQQGNMHA